MVCICLLTSQAITHTHTHIYIHIQRLGQPVEEQHKCLLFLHFQRFSKGKVPQQFYRILNAAPKMFYFRIHTKTYFKVFRSKQITQYSLRRLPMVMMCYYLHLWAGQPCPIHCLSLVVYQDKGQDYDLQKNQWEFSLHQSQNYYSVEEKIYHQLKQKS